MKATLSNYKQSPRKVRLVADFIRGKKVSDALNELSFLDKRASSAIKQVLESAIANAKENNNKSLENLYIKEITVNKGITLKRFMPVSRGRAHPIHRHRSHINIVLSEYVEDSETREKNKKIEKKEHKTNESSDKADKKGNDKNKQQQNIKKEIKK